MTNLGAHDCERGKLKLLGIRWYPPGEVNRNCRVSKNKDSMAYGLQDRWVTVVNNNIHLDHGRHFRK